MDDTISDSELSRFSEFVAGATGLDFPPPRWPDLRRGIAATADELGFEKTATCARALMEAPATKDQLAVLASHLTVGETYFFREPESFEVLAKEVLPPLIHKRQAAERRLRIWSTACCTGEEAYSIAILLHRAIPDLRDWHLTLLATDINPRFLHKAIVGVFGDWSFRNAPPWLKERYFRSVGNGRFEIIPEIKRLVQFANLNLIEDVYPSLATDTNAMDVIFCRNVLMYFTASNAEKVIENLHRSQIDGGCLLVGASELANVSRARYAIKNFDGVMLFQKGGPKVPPRRAIVEPPPIVRSELLPGGDIVPEVIPASHPIHVDQPTQPPIDSPPPVDFDLLARSLANEGKLADALACCDQWIATDKLSSPAHYLRAVIAQEQGATDEALQSLRRALYLNPNLVLAHFTLGNMARQRGDETEAAKHLENALKLLRGRPAEEIVPESDGMTAGRLAVIIQSLRNVEAMA